MYRYVLIYTLINLLSQYDSKIARKKYCRQADEPRGCAVGGAHLGGVNPLHLEKRTNFVITDHR